MSTFIQCQDIIPSAHPASQAWAKEGGCIAQHQSQEFLPRPPGKKHAHKMGEATLQRLIFQPISRVVFEKSLYSEC